MYAQLQRLAEIAELPNVRIQILPLKAIHRLAVDSFSIFQFGSAHETVLHDVVGLERAHADARGVLHLDRAKAPRGIADFDSSALIDASIRATQFQMCRRAFRIDRDCAPSGTRSQLPLPAPQSQVSETDQRPVIARLDVQGGLELSDCVIVISSALKRSTSFAVSFCEIFSLPM